MDGDEGECVKVYNEARWPEYPSFIKEEFDCKHTGLNEMKHEFMVKLQLARRMAKIPFDILSGYRDKSHPVESKKETTGTHALGLAADIKCDRQTAYIILLALMGAGFTGIGVNQKGNLRFIHCDIAEDAVGRPRPSIWSY